MLLLTYTRADPLHAAKLIFLTYTAPLPFPTTVSTSAPLHRFKRTETAFKALPVPGRTNVVDTVDHVKLPRLL
jgi:hypothetical protein